MKKIVHYLGLDVHKETIAVAIAPEQSGEIRKCGIIGGTLDPVEKLIKKVQQETIEPRFGAIWCEPGRQRSLRNAIFHRKIPLMSSATPFSIGKSRWERV